jgi:hypothetical protein
MHTSALGARRALPHVHWQRNITTPAVKAKILKACMGKDVGPTYRLTASPDVAWGHCRYLEDQVPPRTNSKPRQEAGHATTHRHMSHSTGPSRLVREGSGSAMHPMALDPTSLHGRALVSPHIPPLQTLPSWLGGLRSCQVSQGSGSRLPAQEGPDVVMCPTAIYGG